MLLCGLGSKTQTEAIMEKSMLSGVIPTEALDKLCLVEHSGVIFISFRFIRANSFILSRGWSFWTSENVVELRRFSMHKIECLLSEIFNTSYLQSLMDKYDSKRLLRQKRLVKITQDCKLTTPLNYCVVYCDGILFS